MRPLASGLLRLLIFFAVLLCGDLIAQIAAGWLVRHAPPHLSPGWARLAAALALSALLAGLYVTLVRRIEHRSAQELSPRTTQALLGIALGFALFGSVVALLRLLGVAGWVGLGAGSDSLTMLSRALLAAVGEELAFRGGLFRILEENTGTAVALAVSAAFFGIVHAFNSGATVISTLAIALEAGVLLGAAYALTRNLWFPIGVHLGWNFTEGGVFGASVSGGAPSHGIFAVSIAGPRLLTGGPFGPEASIIAVAVCLAAALPLIALVVGTGRWLPLPRHSRRMLPNSSNDTGR